MKKQLSITLLFLLSAYISVCQPQSNLEIVRQTIIEADLNNVERYLEFLPAGYDPNGTEKYPLIIFLHGQGERDNNLSGAYKVAKLGLPKYIEERNYNMCYMVDGQEKCFIVISPQLQKTRSNGQNLTTWSAGFTNSVIDHVLNNYNVDTDRIYLTGHSMGGIGVYKYLSSTSNEPNKIAAAAPIAANGLTDTQGCTISERKIDLTHFHGDSDNVIGDVSGRAAFDKIVFCSTSSPDADLRFILYDGVGHNTTPNIALDSAERLDGENIYEWFLGHSLNDSSIVNSPPVVNAGSDITVTLPQDSVLISGTASDNDGNIDSVFWTQISGTTLQLSGESTLQLTVRNLAAGSYSFKLTAKDDNGISASDTVLLTVQPAGTTEMGVISERFLASKSLPYLEYLPPNYNTAGDRYPVLIYFHSEDAKGSDSLELVKNEGPFYYLDQQTDNFCFTVNGVEQCFIVIAPQVEIGKGFYKGKVNALYDEIINNYHSDPSSIYISGYDDGANGMFTRLLDAENNPNRFAGVAAVGSKIINSLNPSAVGMLSPKIWMAHSQVDERYSLASAKQFYNQMVAVNTNKDTLFVEYVTEDHVTSMFRAFDPGDSLSFYYWLFNDTVNTPDPDPDPADSIGTVSEKLIASRNFRYLEYLPPNYNTAGDKYPVLIYFHSKKAKGTDSLELVAQEGPFYHIMQENKEFCFTVSGQEKCFIVVAPQVEVGKGFSKGRVNALIDELLTNYHSDSTQFYITGADDGANNVFVRILDAENTPNRFAGIGVAGLSVASALDEVAIGAIDPKLWMGHSDTDAQYYYQGAVNFYNDVRAATGSSDTLFITYNNITHEETIRRAFDPEGTESMYGWLFADQGAAAARSTNLPQVLQEYSNNSEHIRKDYVVDELTAGQLFDQIDSDFHMLIYHYSGRLVNDGSVSEGISLLGGDSPGLYFYRISDHQNTLLLKGKILIK